MYNNLLTEQSYAVSIGSDLDISCGVWHTCLFMYFCFLYFPFSRSMECTGLVADKFAVLLAYEETLSNSLVKYVNHYVLFFMSSSYIATV